jgi:hypothetical protein
MNRDDRAMTDEEFVQHLISVGWEREEAIAELRRTLEEAAEEDGMG